MFILKLIKTIILWIIHKWDLKEAVAYVFNIGWETIPCFVPLKEYPVYPLIVFFNGNFKSLSVFLRVLQEWWEFRIKSCLRKLGARSLRDLNVITFVSFSLSSLTNALLGIILTALFYSFWSLFMSVVLQHPQTEEQYLKWVLLCLYTSSSRYSVVGTVLHASVL